MPKGFKHLTREKRYQISVLLKSGLLHRAIARQIEVHHSTVSHEVKRCVPPKTQDYSPSKAHKDAVLKRKNSARTRNWLPQIKAYVDEKLNQHWSPEQISGRLKQDHPALSMSHEAIYQYVWADKKASGNLYKKLLRGQKKYFKRGSKKQQRGAIPDHKAISTALKADIYFARPYKSCDLGLNEHINGLIRKFFPKGKPFQDTSEENIARVENLLNNRPRKSLNFRTPNEVFFAQSP